MARWKVKANKEVDAELYESDLTPEILALVRMSPLIELALVEGPPRMLRIKRSERTLDVPQNYYIVRGETGSISLIDRVAFEDKHELK
jgi:hypothetical protein